MNIFERRKRTKDLFLGIFKEEGILEKDLEEAILSTYNIDEEIYKTFDDIPSEIMEEAICDTCEAAGLKFSNFEDILDYFYNNK